MKGIILAGGTGSRLRPITLGVSKQLLPVYDKPMIYYPLSVLVLAGIRDILVITTPEDSSSFVRLLGDGSQFGLRLSYTVQPKPNGLAEALLLSEDFVAGDDVCLVLGDNIFLGRGFTELLHRESSRLDGCTLFGARTKTPERYGVAELADDGRLVDIVEKPLEPRSNLAVTGLYMFDGEAASVARRITPSRRGELEITDVNRDYLLRGKARLVDLGRGFTWLDAGTEDSLLEASEFVQVLTHRQGMRPGCVEEVSLRAGLISAEHALGLADDLGECDYADYVREIALEYDGAPNS